MIEVDTSSFFAIVLVAAIAAITVAVVPRGLAPPVVVLRFFSSLGLGMLFYFAGYEIDFERIEGAPLKLGAIGWAMSVALAYGIGACSLPPASSFPSSTPARRWRRPRSAR